jgi:hypothetical protein
MEQQKEVRKQQFSFYSPFISKWVFCPNAQQMRQTKKKENNSLAFTLFSRAAGNLPRSKKKKIFRFWCFVRINNITPRRTSRRRRTKREEREDVERREERRGRGRGEEEGVGRRPLDPIGPEPPTRVLRRQKKKKRRMVNDSCRQALVTFFFFDFVSSGKLSSPFFI